jgi:hypothetical protein
MLPCRVAFCSSLTFLHISSCSCIRETSHTHTHTPCGWLAVTATNTLMISAGIPHLECSVHAAICSLFQQHRRRCFEGGQPRCKDTCTWKVCGRPSYMHQDLSPATTGQTQVVCGCLPCGASISGVHGPHPGCTAVNESCFRLTSGLHPYGVWPSKQKHKLIARNPQGLSLVF